MKLPDLTIGKGTSGLEIRAVLNFEPNCVEFTMRGDCPQPIFISPWIQFEDPKLVEFRMQVAMEIIRRTLAYDSMEKELEKLRASDEHWKDAYYKLRDSPEATRADLEVK